MIGLASEETAPGILVTGDSLSAAYGMPLEQGWVALLQKKLQEAGYPQQVINTSVSGETTSGALARLEQELQRYQPQIVIIELGGNDGLRGLSLSKLRSNLQKMVQLSQQAGIKVLLLGMRLPSNYGATYTEQFHQSYQDVAAQMNIAIVPFFLEPIALERKLFQDDGVHPSAEAQPLLLNVVWPKLEPLLK